MATSPPGFGPTFAPMFDASAASRVVESWLFVTPQADTGTATGTITFTGTTVGAEGVPGTAAGTITLDGVVVGVKYEPTVGAPLETTGGGRAYPYVHPKPIPKRVEDYFSETVHGRIGLTGVIRGRASRASVAAGGFRSLGVPTSTAHRGGSTESTIRTVHRIRAEAASMHGHDEIRRARDDADLLLIL